MKNRIIKIVSGGQTGADRGGLDAAIELGVPHGGWCPKGRIAEDGTVPVKYRLKEATSKAYARRTELNVKYSTATVVLCDGEPGRGSQKTVEFAEKHGKACLLLDTNDDIAVIIKSITDWIDKLPYTKVILNVAGSRGSQSPTLQHTVKGIVSEVIAAVNQLDLAEDHAEYHVIRVIELPFYPDLKKMHLVNTGWFQRTKHIQLFQLAQEPCSHSPDLSTKYRESLCAFGASTAWHCSSRDSALFVN